MDCFYMVSTKEGGPYKMRDGKGHHRPSRKVDVEPIPFLFCPPLGRELIADKIVLEPDSPQEVVDIFVELKEEEKRLAIALAEAQEILAMEKKMFGGKFVRSIPQILENPSIEGLKEQMGKLAQKKAQQAGMVVEMLDELDAEEVDVDDVDDADDEGY